MIFFCFYLLARRHACAIYRPGRDLGRVIHRTQGSPSKVFPFHDTLLILLHRQWVFYYISCLSLCCEYGPHSSKIHKNGPHLFQDFTSSFNFPPKSAHFYFLSEVLRLVFCFFVFSLVQSSFRSSGDNYNSRNLPCQMVTELHKFSF